VPDDTAPLHGLVILDFTRVLAGPYCTRLLADLGARVIKVERAGGGDDMRKGHLQLEPGRDDQSSYFTRINVGKESVGLHLGRPESRKIVGDLARKADVAVENFAPGVAERLGVDYETLVAVRPDLVYCSISGFGQTGPWRERPAFAHIIHAASGLMHLEQGDSPAPRVANLQAADVLSGAHAFGAILAALWRRARTGKGARIDVSMLETLIAADDVSVAAVLNGGEEIGSPRPGMAIYEIGGRHLALQTGGSAEIWPRLLEMMDRPELAHDARFSTAQARREHWPLLRDLIGHWLTRFRTVDEAVTALASARIPSAPVLEPREVVAHPHLLERQAFPDVPHPSRGRVRVTASPYHWDGRPVHPAGPAPYRVGEHSRMVLSGLLGYDTARIDTLIASGAVEAP
jgi:crotonobetainyl-CoA:carnitine CoA-transferase CaiB-like acyl-CoA transferase